MIFRIINEGLFPVIGFKFSPEFMTREEIIEKVTGIARREKWLSRFQINEPVPEKAFLSKKVWQICLNLKSRPKLKSGVYIDYRYPQIRLTIDDETGEIISKFISLR